ncbi:MAG: methyltransferase domain-containing protein [Rhodanobacter sp.]|nr:MAG: methyltransferase domain-containing protein [Rhodanobacter sp.]TAL91759.1 MAG: methyltransferase domain-containing protein [Rhodanobacter sp.]TAM42580.1 MAG: methyltransferase domain-containing protein [Rhodanobacter sp.]TAN26237.1 MAG: methyltransferase domain-containing protein [Rhodanobacter sp.]
MSSVTPSGRQLSGMMAAAVPTAAGGVIELGAGTGVITHALIKHGVKPEQLLLVEMNEVLHDLLRHTFPHAHVVCGDARTLQPLIAGAGAFGNQPIGAVVSSLGLLTMPVDVQHDILAAAFGVLRPGGVFVQYTYGPSRPVAPDVCTALGLHWRRHGLAWRNLPPAGVYIYSRA